MNCLQSCVCLIASLEQSCCSKMCKVCLTTLSNLVLSKADYIRNDSRGIFGQIVGRISGWWCCICIDGELTPENRANITESAILWRRRVCKKGNLVLESVYVQSMYTVEYLSKYALCV